MNETNKLPKGASKWWNKPVNELTDEQRAIKRQYARELYKKKREPSLADYKQRVATLEDDIQFSQLIIENYKIRLRKQLDNNNMSDVQKLSEYPKQIINKEDYVHFINSNSTLPTILCSGDVFHDALTVMAATKSKLVKIRYPVPRHKREGGGVCSGVSEVTIKRVGTGQNQLVLQLNQGFDCLFGLQVPGNIIAVTVELQKGCPCEEQCEDLPAHQSSDGRRSILIQETETYICSKFKGSKCTFDPPLIHPQWAAMWIVVTFDNSLRLEKWEPDPIVEIETGYIETEVRNQLCKRRRVSFT
ncbi:hypothetical protein LCGC14_2172070, partial [marine sediment metagenome]